MTICNTTGNSHFWAWSNFNIFANFDLLMANDGLLNLSRQAEFVLGFFEGGRYNYNNNNLVQGKQTVDNDEKKHHTRIIPMLRE